MDGEARDKTVAAAVSDLSSGSDGDIPSQSDHHPSDSAPSIPPGMESHSVESSGAVEDRTAAEMFADLKAADGTVDADAVLEATSPNELIDRAAEPSSESEGSTDLFDEAAFEANIIPDREPDGEFLWIDLGDSTSASSDHRTDAAADSTADTDDGSESPSAPESDAVDWTELAGQPSVDRIEDDHVESTVSSLSTTVATDPDPADGTTDDERSPTDGTAESSDHESADGVRSPPGGPNDGDSEAERNPNGSSMTDPNGDDDRGSDASPDRSTEPEVGWLESNELDVSRVRTESTSAASHSKPTTDGPDSTTVSSRSVVTDEFDSVSATGSGRVPTRTDPSERSGGSTSSGERSTTRDRRSGTRSRSDARSPDPAGGSAAADSTGSNPLDESDASEVRTTVVPFDRHRQREPDSTGRIAGLRQLIGRFRNSSDLG